MGLVIHDDLSFARITRLRYVIYQPSDDQIVLGLNERSDQSRIGSHKHGKDQG